MFNEFEEVQEYIAGKKVTRYCLDEYIFKIARYMKEEGKPQRQAVAIALNVQRKAKPKMSRGRKSRM